MEVFAIQYFRDNYTGSITGNNHLKFIVGAVGAVFASVFGAVLLAAPAWPVIFEQLAGIMAITAGVTEVTMCAAIPMAPSIASVRPI